MRVSLPHLMLDVKFIEGMQDTMLVCVSQNTFSALFLRRHSIESFIV